MKIKNPRDAQWDSKLFKFYLNNFKKSIKFHHDKIISKMDNLKWYSNEYKIKD
jgi:hypothetical protein